MSAKTSLSLLAGVALMAMGAVAFGATDTASLGQSLGGESCRLSNGIILCGDNESGTLRISQLTQDLPGDTAARHDAILSAAHALPGGLATTQDVSCDPAQWVGDDALFLCTLRSNGWPRIILVGGNGSTLACAGP